MAKSTLQHLANHNNCCMYAALRIPDALKTRFCVDACHAAKFKDLEKQVADANTAVVLRALKGSAASAAATPSTTRAGAPPQAPPRTSCQPAFSDSDQPVDVNRVVDLATIPSQDFHSTHTWFGEK